MANTTPPKYANHINCRYRKYTWEWRESPQFTEEPYEANVHMGRDNHIESMLRSVFLILDRRLDNPDCRFVSHVCAVVAHSDSSPDTSLHGQAYTTDKLFFQAVLLWIIRKTTHKRTTCMCTHRDRATVCLGKVPLIFLFKRLIPSPFLRRCSRITKSHVHLQGELAGGAVWSKNIENSQNENLSPGTVLTQFRAKPCRTSNGR